MKIFITGGTGSLGQSLIGLLNKEYGNNVEIISMSRSEDRIIKAKQYSNVSYIIGDVSNIHSILLASINCDVIFHLAAIKHIDIAENNPIETIESNIVGTSNIIKAAKINKIEKVIYVSTDKAASSNGIYGLSKLISEKNILNSSSEQCKMSVIRLGNIFNSSGSVFLKWIDSISKNENIMVTDINATRFFISPYSASKALLHIMKTSRGGEIFIPKMKSFNLYELAIGYSKGVQAIDIIGLRKNENIHELLISNKDHGKLIEYPDYYIINFGNDRLDEISSNSIKFLSNFKTFKSIFLEDSKDN